jgi:hypothetical protein
MRRTPTRTATMALLAAVLMLGCAADDGDLGAQEGQHDMDEPGTDEPDTDGNDADEPDATEPRQLEHPLRFEATGQEGFRRLEIEPNGSGERQLNLGDPTPFTLDDDQLAEVAAAVHDADLPAQAPELRGEEPDLTDETFRFGYGEAEIEAEWQHAPDEIRELGRLLLDIFHAEG